VARDEALIGRAEVVEALRQLLRRDRAATLLGPVLARSEFSDEQAADALTRGWAAATEPAERLALVETLLARKTLSDVEEPTDAVRALLRAAVHDPSAAVRERVLTALRDSERLRRG